MAPRYSLLSVFGDPPFPGEWNQTHHEDKPRYVAARMGGQQLAIRFKIPSRRGLTR